MKPARVDRDPFQRMVALSGTAHAFVFLAILLTNYWGPSGEVLPEAHADSVRLVKLGEFGPIPGASPPTPLESAVVRPRKRQRDDIPQPNAPPTKATRVPRPKQDTGIPGPESANADSATPKGNTAEVPAPGAGGGGSSFDQDFEYAYYVRQMQSRIQRHWKQPAVHGTAVVIVRFTILEDGTVLNTEIEQSSGASILDRGALRAVELASPMPPLPNGYARDRVGVHLRFVYPGSR